MADYRPQIPAYDHHIALFTFEDAVDQVLDSFKVDRTAYHLRQARRAVLDAYRDLPQRHRWPYFDRRAHFTTVAQQTTGTVVFDYTGGAYERMLTLTGSTWPTAAREYGIKFNSNQYGIEDRKSSTIITLDKNRSPVADVASTTYVLYKAWYPLPTDFRSGSQILQLNGASVEPYPTDLAGVLERQYGNISPNTPLAWCVTSGGKFYGGLGIEFGPPPSTAITFDAIYRSNPRPVFYERYSAGTVSLSSVTVTGTNTAFDSRMVGSVIRFPPNSNNGQPPTGVAGSTDGGHNPYAAERTIIAVASATSLTIDAAVSETVSGASYTISDPVDLEPIAMRTAFLRMAEAFYAVYSGKLGDRGYRQKLADEALLFAMENSVRYSPGGSDTPGYIDVHDGLTISTESSE